MTIETMLSVRGRSRTCWLLLALMCLGWPCFLASAQMAYVPFVLRETSGPRPFVDVAMNGKPFSLMVHANAVFGAMTTHSRAESIGITDLKKSSNFGISSLGHVDSSGRAETILASLVVGGRTFKDVPLSVFEVPGNDVDGMLGIKWLTSANVEVDFRENRIGLPSTLNDSIAEDARLERDGYVAHRMSWNPAKQAFFISVSINGATAHLMVSTVANSSLDTGFASRAKVEAGFSAGHFYGPQGTTGDEFYTKNPVDVLVEQQTIMPTRFQIIDYYEYNNQRRPDNPSDSTDGSLGASFMTANRAVIDFGTGVLLLPLKAP